MQNDTFIYYVYAYLREDGSPYYIGKGKNGRYRHTHDHVKVPNLSKIVFLETNLSEIGALALERRYILWYGRKDNNTGILRNFTDGGEGASGHIKSEETRAKLRKPKQKYTRIYVMTDEHKEKIRRSNTGKTHSNTTKKLIGEKSLGRTSGMKGKKMSIESRIKVKNAAKNRWNGLTDVEKSEKIKALNALSFSQKGQPGKKHTEESKLKMRAAWVGRVVSEETKKKMSESHKKRYNKELSCH